jgi:hypothetical protein
LQADDLAGHRPRQAAIRTIVRYSSVSSPRTKRMSCTLSTRGIDRRPPRCRTRSNGVGVGYLPAPSMLEDKMQKAAQVYL